MNENSLKNLRPPWRKGESGNVSGRRPRPLQDAFTKVVMQKASPQVVKALRRFGLRPGATVADVIAAATVKQAARGRTEAAKLVIETVEGRAGIRGDLDGGATIELHVVMDAPIRRASSPVIDVAETANPISALIEESAGKADDDEVIDVPNDAPKADS
jgi:hypothetical protein